MDAWRYTFASLRHYRRVHIAVMLGVAVATAVLTGALLVGDSVRGSLRDLTLERLGKIDTVLVAGHPFRAALASELAAGKEFKQYFESAEPAFLLNGSLQAGSGKDARRATNLSVVGIVPGFWSLGEGGPALGLDADQVAITEPIAQELGVHEDDDILLRVPIATAVPADSTLGKKTDTSLGRVMKVGAVLPVAGLARFGLAPTQQLPRNVFVPLATAQKLLKQPKMANAVLIALRPVDRATEWKTRSALVNSLHPKLEDFGVTVSTDPSPTGAFVVSADQLVLPEAVVKAVDRYMPDTYSQRVVTYLANTISAGEGTSKRTIPYSTITGVDSTDRLGPLRDDKGKAIKLADDEIVLNRWAADDLKVKLGDPITVTYYEPESTHGELREHEPAPVFKLRAIAELKTADGKPKLAADPNLTPELPGVTDQKSISDWDLPFELVEKVRKKDEDYWHDYRTTPKAFVSLATAKRLWASRWGAISLIRFPADAYDKSAFEDARQIAEAQLPLLVDWSAMGMMFLPVQEQGLAASAGTTPFEWLFLGFSFFLIAAAVMLVALLFRLGIEQRASELGTLAAVGVGRRATSRLLAREGTVVAAIGASIGVALGVLYAWLMIFGLRTWWLAAVSTPFIHLHIEPQSLLIGWVTGIVASWVTIRWSIRRLVRQPVNGLISGNTLSQLPGSAARRGSGVLWRIASIVLLALVVIQCAGGFFLEGESKAGSFFGSGFAALVLLLGEVRYRLRHLRRDRRTDRSFSLQRLSMFNIARNPGRSTLTIGLVAAASFLIAAVSAFRLGTSDGGTGGFELTATSDLPIHYDLNTTEGRRELGFSDDANKELGDWRFYSLRVAAGENASCLNLYQPKQPTVLGVSQSLIDRAGFAWAETDAHLHDKPWMGLNVDFGKDEAGREIVPVVLDASTAAYSLRVGGVGSQFKIRDGAGRDVTLIVNGLLENSVLQGNVLMSESNFVKVFPDVAGYRFFLIQREGEAPAEPSEVSGSAGASPSRDVAQILESTLADEGFDATDAREQLAQLLAVQNTYLATFQSLGGLGLLLGTIGLAVVQLRSVLERRAELALMRAEGFAPARLVTMVVEENAILLVGGLIIGCAAAAIALIPQWLPHGASVPWGTLGLLLGAIAVVGLVAGWLSTRAAVRAPILAALRGD
jgi:putative ABC transport system permease protein